MKKILLGTTGLVGAALLATAASAETPKVTLGGFSDFQAGWTSDDRDANTRSVGFRNDNEVDVKVDGKTDAGLGYGAEIDLEADTTSDVNNQGVNASRTFTYLDGKWGRFEMGDNKSVAATMRVDASTLAVATGGINGAWSDFVQGVPTNVNGTHGAVAGGGFVTESKLLTEHGSTNTFGDESTYNATKVNYYTPKYAGFQAGVSYTPNDQSRGQTLVRDDNFAATANGQIGNVIDAGLSYENQFSGGIKLSVAATGEWGQADTAGVEDTAAWNAGALLGWKGFSVAGSYGDWEDSNNVSGADSTYWTAGLGYEAGPVGLSATYINSTRQVAGTSDNDFTNLVLGADYKLAPGLTPYAEVSFYDFDANGNGGYDNNGTSVILGTQVAF
jgi:outer membrane protein OmpU